jgi:hypothetical protein
MRANAELCRRQGSVALMGTLSDDRKRWGYVKIGRRGVTVGVEQRLSGAEAMWCKGRRLSS